MIKPNEKLEFLQAIQGRTPHTIDRGHWAGSIVDHANSDLLKQINTGLRSKSEAVRRANRLQAEDIPVVG